MRDRRLTHAMRAPAMTLLALVACGHASMVTYQGVRSEHEAEFFADGTTLVMRVSNPGVGTLVPYPPAMENGKVVLEIGVVSGGTRTKRTHCLPIQGANPGADWPNRLFLREYDGKLVKIASVNTGEPARAAAALCAAPAK